MRFAPVLCLLERTRRERNDLRGELARVREELNETKAELCVAKVRERRWRRLAFKWGGGHPEARREWVWQAMTDDIADAPEIEETDRNAGPRSLP